MIGLCLTPSWLSKTRSSSSASSLSFLLLVDLFFLNLSLSITLDLSEFNVNVMTGNNGAHQRSSYDPVIRKLPFFFVQTPEFFSTSMKLPFASYIMSSIEVKKNSGWFCQVDLELDHSQVLFGDFSLFLAMSIDGNVLLLGSHILICHNLLLVCCCPFLLR